VPLIATELPLPQNVYTPDGANIENGSSKSFKLEKRSARIGEAKKMSKDFLSTHGGRRIDQNNTFGIERAGDSWKK
jgi:hypothetical protein